MTTQCIQVKLELGHKANIRPQLTTEGFTHDWTVFVRGPEGSNIQHFVERVVFHLHDSFPKPKRVVKEPPYQVIESGYAGFTLPIEVFFKSKEEPKKVQFQYDLFLHLEGPPISHIRCEKLTFQNPTEEFRRKLIRAGGGTMSNWRSKGRHPVLTVPYYGYRPPQLHESTKSDVYIGGLLGKSSASQDVCTEPTSVKSTTTSRHSSKHDSNVSASDGASNQSLHRTSATSSLHSEPFTSSALSSSSASASNKPKVAHNEVLPSKNIRPTIPSKEGNRATVAQSAGPPQSFVALFGQPIKTSKPSPDSQRLKDGGQHHQKAASKTPKLSQPMQKSPLSMLPTPTTNVQPQQSVAKDTAKKEAKTSHQLMVPGKDVARTKMKRSPSPAVHNALASEGDAAASAKKRKRSSNSVSSNQTKPKTEKAVKEKEKEKVVAAAKDVKVKVKKEKDKEKEKKEKHKNATVPVAAEEDKPRGGKKSEAGERKPVTASGKLPVKKEDVKRESSPVVNSAPPPNTASRPSSKGKKRKPTELTTTPPPLLPPPPPAQPPPLPPPPTLERTPSPSTNSMTAPEDTEPGDGSPGSSISMSSVVQHHDGSKGPLRIMMAEMDDDDEDDDNDIDRVLSPFSSDAESSPPHAPTLFQRLKENSLPVPPPPPTPTPILPPPTPPRVSSMPPPSTVMPCEASTKHRPNVQHRKDKKVRDRGKERDREKEKVSGGKMHKSSSSSSSSAAADVPRGKTNNISNNNNKMVGATELPSGVTVTEECIEELKELQSRISALRDRARLQQIVNVIEETGLYKVTSTTFDFDLCTLDIDTVRKLQTCLASVS